MKRLFVYIFVIFCLAVFLGTASCSRGPEKLRETVTLKDIIIKDNPNGVTLDSSAGVSYSEERILTLFTFPGAKMIRTGVYKSGRYVPAEGVAIFESPEPPEGIEKYLLKTLAKREWHIIQSMTKKNEILLMAESPSLHFKRIVTTIIRKKTDDPRGLTTIKVYFKRSQGG